LGKRQGARRGLPLSWSGTRTTRSAPTDEERRTMTEAEIQFYRQRLLAFTKRLGRDMSALQEEALQPIGGESSGGLSNVPVHLADMGTDNFEEEVTLTLLENEDQIVTEINDAVDRIEKGTFGRCE